MFSPLSPLSSRETLEGRWPAVISLASGLLLEWPAGDMDAGELVFQGFTLVWHLSGNGYLHTCLSEEAKNMQKHYNLHGHSGFSWYIFSRKVYCTRTKVMLNVTHTHTHSQFPHFWPAWPTYWSWVLFVILCNHLNWDHPFIMFWRNKENIELWLMDILLGHAWFEVFISVIYSVHGPFFFFHFVKGFRIYVVHLWVHFLVFSCIYS